MDDKKLIDYLIQRIETIDDKVDKLLEFKWQIVGGSVFLSIMFTIGIQMLALIFGKS